MGFRLIYFSADQDILALLVHMCVMVGFRCCGTTRVGKRCALTSESDFRDRLTGRLVAEPLLRGGRYCLFHCKAFALEERLDSHIAVQHQRVKVIYVDLETTSLDKFKCGILEVGAVAEDCNSAFSSCVHLKTDVVKDGAGFDNIAPHIHGIEEDEIAKAPCFKDVMARFTAFVDRLASPLVAAPKSAEESRTRIATHAARAYAICLIAHDGVSFDFPVLSNHFWINYNDN